MKRVLAVFAHPDDEVLGAGGALAEHVLCGDRVQICILAVGDYGRRREDGQTDEFLGRRRRMVEDAAGALGVDDVSTYEFPDNAFDTVEFLELTSTVEDVVGSFDLEIVYTHFGGDLNRDHFFCANAVLTATRPQSFKARTIIGAEIRSSTEWASPAQGPPFIPNLWVRLGETAARRKIQALEIYAEEMRSWPHSRSIDAVRANLAVRGAEVGAEHAEAFMTLRSTRVIADE